MNPTPVGAVGCFTFEHLQHPVSDHKPTNEVDGAQYDRGGTENQRQRFLCRSRYQDRADQDDAVNGVGAGHQRRMKNR